MKLIKCNNLWGTPTHWESFYIFNLSKQTWKKLRIKTMQTIKYFKQLKLGVLFGARVDDSFYKCADGIVIISNLLNWTALLGTK